MQPTAARAAHNGSNGRDAATTTQRLDYQGNPIPDNYKWIALSNTTLGVLIATINASILLISLPDIFKGIGINPLLPSNTNYLLWLILGFLVVTAVLVVSLGRLGDIYGRARTFNLGFAVFTVFSVLLSVTWMKGSSGALWLIAMRALQGVGGAMLFANSSAIITDAFPPGAARPGARDQRRRRRRRLVDRARARRRARAGRVARGVPRVGAVRHLRDGLGLHEAPRPVRAQAGEDRLAAATSRSPSD